MLTSKEKEILEISVNLWNEFLLLEEYHEDDKKDISFHIHAIQNIIMSREAIRNNPDLFEK